MSWHGEFVELRHGYRLCPNGAA